MPVCFSVSLFLISCRFSSLLRYIGGKLFVCIFFSVQSCKQNVLHKLLLRGCGGTCLFFRTASFQTLPTFCTKFEVYCVSCFACPFIHLIMFDGICGIICDCILLHIYYFIFAYGNRFLVRKVSEMFVKCLASFHSTCIKIKWFLPFI